MPTLEYNFSAIGVQNIHRAFDSIEHRMGRLNAQATRSSAAMSRRMAATQAKAGPYRTPAVADAAERRRAATMERAQARGHAAQIRQIEREKMAKVRADNAAYQNQIRQAEKAAQAEARARLAGQRRFRQTAFGALKGAAGTLASVGRAGIAAVGLGGGALAASAIGQAGRLDETSRRIAIAGRQGGKEAAFTPEQIRSKITQTAVAKGLNPEQLAEGMQAAIDKTGDLTAAMKNLDTVATVTQATGGDATDAFLLQADAMQKFGLNTEESAQAMATLIAQGKKGAFTFKNMAAMAPKTFAAAAAFGFRGQQGLSQIGGLMQVTRDVTGSDEQAAFATEALLRQMTAKGGEMQSGKAFGGRKVDVFKGGDPRKGANNFRDILGGVLRASEGNLSQLQEVFGEEGIRGMRPFVSTFRETREAGLKKGMGREQANKAASDAALKILDNATNVQTTFKDVERDAADAMKSFTVQLEIFNTKMKDAIASEVFPELVKLAPELGKLVPVARDVAKGFVELVRWLSQNPFTGLSAVIAGAFLKEIAAAKIADIIRSGFGGGGMGGPGGAGGGGGLLGGGGGLALAGTAAMVTTAVAADQANKLQKELGTKGSLTDILPGFSQGKFGGETLLKDIVMPWQKVGRFGEAAGETLTAAHDQVARPENRIALQKTTPKAFTSAAAQMPGPVKVEGGADFMNGAKEFSNAVAKFSASAGTLNRGNTPSPPVK